MWTVLAAIGRFVPWQQVFEWFKPIASYFKGRSDARTGAKLQDASARLAAKEQADKVRRDTGKLSDTQLDRGVRRYTRDL